MYRLRNADLQPGAAYRIISMIIASGSGSCFMYFQPGAAYRIISMIIASGSGSCLMVFYPRATSRIIIRTKPKEKATVPQLV